MNRIVIPPIKSQGIKSKLVSWIISNIDGVKYERWIEPFMGTGVVAFNVRPQKALLCDTNPHLINFYIALKEKRITGAIVRDYLKNEGEKLKNTGGDYYYEVRERFNKKGNPLDFLFLSRSCFNGMMRFNKKKEFNVPFCKKPQRFAPTLITKIANQVDNISKIIEYGDYEFKIQDFRTTVLEAKKNDLIYSDPPYIGRHTDYFNSWSEKDELDLREKLFATQANFLVSTWLKNKYRTNKYIFSVWQDVFIAVKEHFYHIGGKEENRNAVYEALLSNIKLKESITIPELRKRMQNNSLLTSSREQFLRNTPTLFD